MSGAVVIAGLGNPGPRYNGTRHNIGFSVVDLLASVGSCASEDEFLRLAQPLLAEALDGRLDHNRWVDKGERLESSFSVGGVGGGLVKPRTFMNRSGEPLQPFLAFRKVPLTALIVVHDEIDIPAGALRVKFGGGEGGHNGLRSIVAVCGGKDFARVRVGVGKPPPEAPGFQGEEGIARWVLSRYVADEKTLMEALVLKAAQAALSLAKDGLSATQNRFNLR